MRKEFENRYGNLEKITWKKDIVFFGKKKRQTYNNLEVTPNNTNANSYAEGMLLEKAKELRAKKW